MTIQLNSGDGYFTLNEESFPTGAYRVVYHGDNVGLTERNLLPIVHPVSYTDWRDSTNSPYASRAALITDLQLRIFR